MKKLAFVIPWYGDTIPGGAEMETRGAVRHLIASGLDVEILTTCVKDFNSDWNVNFHKPGLTEESGVPVRRFKVRRRNTKAFDAVNYKLMTGAAVSGEEEQTFLREMVNSPDLYAYIAAHRDEYTALFFIPYMFGTTFFGAEKCPDKAILIPCFHDEAYIYLDIYKEVFQKAAGMIFLSKPEQELANRVFDLSGVAQIAMGAGVDTDVAGSGDAFRKKFRISDPYIMYAGRKDAGKNVDLLLSYFCVFKKLHPESPLKLVLVGGGRIDVPDFVQAEVRDLGFVDPQDKYDGYAGALCLCQPSTHESFSLVIMESWLCGRPVLVHGGCAVTKSFVIEAGGGLYFDNYPEFEGCVEYYLAHPETAAEMGRNGESFVRASFAWDVIVRQYREFLKTCGLES